MDEYAAKGNKPIDIQVFEGGSEVKQQEDSFDNEVEDAAVGAENMPMHDGEEDIGDEGDDDEI